MEMNNMDDINVDMGDFEIQCDKDRILWRVTDKLGGSSREFESLDDVLDWIREEVESVVIEEDGE
jgi:hypothetical protein